MIQLTPNYSKRSLGSALAFALLSLPSALYSQTAATFDIERYSTFGEGFFETFYVDETLTLQEALDSKLLTPATELLVTETTTGNLALVRDQMAFHHIAQGEADGVAWMATF